MPEASTRQRRSVIVDCVTRAIRPISTAAIAEQLGIELELACTRVRQLEDGGRLRRVGTATRVRDIRWMPAVAAIVQRPSEEISYRAAENIEAMRAALLLRIERGQRADWNSEKAGAIP
ncbi:hypothetical protein G3N59_10435 [Paraburkholderia sp. Ac-20340]|uniref:hypothetical protein n=1 Tax=Paraburkholderia sp. Ac-20340 TaxID=2703888 RepID=UPI00198118C7|nr:hypothetical protein [Paraburkholderia sp. Ac-20340]MBN3853797.1 hypothetical protein [Paraburkholderia sp. Ac-20340]